MKKIILLFVCIFATTLSNAQTVKGNLESRQMFVVGNNLLVTGCLMRENKVIFKGILYNDELKILKEYEKELPEDIDLNFHGQVQYPSVYMPYDIMNIGIRAKFEKTYMLKVTNDLKEISYIERPFYGKPKVKDENHKILYPFQQGIEGDPYSIGTITLTGERVNSIKNNRFLNTDIIDFDRKTGIITRNKLNESELDYSKIWQSKLDNGDKIKLLGFSYVDEDDIIGCFIVKEKGDWNDYIYRLDAKTGAIKFMVRLKYPDENEDFLICNTYFDKQNNNLIVIGKLCSSGGKKKCNAMAIFLVDKNGSLITSQKINWPEYEVKEPKGFDFKDKNIMVKWIGKLPNGNYFFDIINSAHYYSSQYAANGGFNGNGSRITSTSQSIVGFSYYEVSDKLNVINSNFKIEENFAKLASADINYPYMVNLETSKDGKYVFLKELYNYTISLKMIDIASKDGKTIELKYIDAIEEEGGIKTTKTYGGDFQIFVLNKNLITFKTLKGSNNYEITTMPIK